MLALVAIVGTVTGCSESPRSEVREPQRPLQPLVYTEDPDHSPKTARARERRLMRELLEGAGDDDGDWGTMTSESDRDISPPSSPEDLGRELYRALVEQRDASWDAAFVEPGSYASLVEVSLEESRTYVDAKQAEAYEARQSFAIENPSEAPEDGLSSIFALEQLALGEGRTLDGDIAGDDETVTQYWNNRLELSLEKEDVVFEVKIPKILRIPSPAEGERADGESAQLGVASTLRIGSRLRVFLDTGMHLKPELLRSVDYPIPLAVGNYWRYRRSVPSRAQRPDGDTAPEDTSEEEKRTQSAPAGENSETDVSGVLEATQVTLKVRAVDRFGTRRLVSLRWLYNDAELTRISEHWLMTPRRIYLCPRPCQRHADDLSWLLAYLRRQTPIFRFPPTRGEDWGRSSAGGAPTFTTGQDWNSLEVSAGSFFGAFEIRGTGPLRRRVPFYRIQSLRRTLAPGTGVVRRSYKPVHGSPEKIVESLTDFRLMTR